MSVWIAVDEESRRGRRGRRGNNKYSSEAGASNSIDQFLTLSDMTYVRYSRKNLNLPPKF